MGVARVANRKDAVRVERMRGTDRHSTKLIHYGFEQEGKKSGGKPTFLTPS
jgi:hypothetical protein